MSHELTLLADIGGTNVRFALADVNLAAPLLAASIRQYEAARFPTLLEAAQCYLQDASASEAAHDAVFAVAGRISGDEAQVTNQPWLISRAGTARALGLSDLRLVNDFAAQAMAIDLLADQDLAPVGGSLLPLRGERRTFAVLGPGTGLGVSALIVRDGVRTALETEGGHVTFAAGTAREATVAGLLAADFGRVSNERLVSGGGLVNIHRVLSRLSGRAPTDALQPRDIRDGARAGDATCAESVALFCAVFGAIAGDLVLTLGAWDGVYLTGGLVPRLLPELQASEFRRRFENKGRFAAAMASVPTVAVLHPQAGLLGAASIANQHAKLTSGNVESR